MKKAALVWQRLRQPSLMRRIVMALLLSYLLVALALLLNDYLDVKRSFEHDLAIKVRAEGMAPILARLSDEHDAAVMVGSMAELFNTRRASFSNLPRSVIHQLRRADGSLVLASPAGSSEAFKAETGRITEAEIGGTVYWAVQVEAGPWWLAIAEPASSEWHILRLLAMDIIDKLVLVFPLVLLPLWLAVRSGVAPLRQLARKVGSRTPDDLAPLGVAPPHAELKPLVAAFEQLLDRLRHKVRLERAFVQDAAHEMRTPMAAITAQCHVLARTEDPAQRLAAEATLTQMLARAAHLNQQLLELATLDDAQASQRQRHDLVQLVEQALALVVPQASAQGLELSLEAPEKLERELELPAFQSILHNLIDNALRYVPTGGRVCVTLAASAVQWSFTVADDGPGIAPGLRERAFDRFWRGGHATIRGSGLGLAIVRQAALRLGGSIVIEDGLDGRGAAFVLRVATP